MQPFILPTTYIEATSFAQMRLWLNALSFKDAAIQGCLASQFADLSTHAFLWKPQPSVLLEADWLQEVASHKPAMWHIHCAEKATPPAAGCLLCVEKTKEQGLLLRRFEYLMRFDESLVRWHWLELLAQQHQCAVWGVIPVEQ